MNLEHLMSGLTLSRRYFCRLGNPKASSRCSDIWRV